MISINQPFKSKLKSKQFIREFWTSKQRQFNKIHEISYRACFKPNLVEYFVNQFSHPKDYVYDPFAGRGTTAIQSALMKRYPITNDINPLSQILTVPRLNPPQFQDIRNRLDLIFDESKQINQINELSMFYNNRTYQELLTLKNYLHHRKQSKNEDHIDQWIRMVATNRLTGHSPGFFSVYTLPPNQAISRKNQIKINQMRNQKPEYRNVKSLIFKKSKLLLSNINPYRKILEKIRHKALIINTLAHQTKNIPNDIVSLVVTSPPFMDTVNYTQDNWLRCWFNEIDIKKVANKITMSKKLIDWECEMLKTLIELKRVLKNHGKIAFEVGEIKKGKIKLDESIVKLSEKAGLKYHSTLINQQNFTKTSNIWGIKNNTHGTNTNRIVILEK